MKNLLEQQKACVIVLLIGFFREEPGIFPSWHRNRAHWLTVALDGMAENKKITFLVDMRYELTNGRDYASPVLC